jgi:hypothetical protein
LREAQRERQRKPVDRSHGGPLGEIVVFDPPVNVVPAVDLRRPGRGAALPTLVSRIHE